MNETLLKYKKVTSILFIVYFLLLTWIIVFKTEFSISSLVTERSINLIPFKESVIVNGKISFSEIINNAIVFIPVGVFTAMLADNLKFIKMAAVFIVAAGIWNLSGFIHAASLSVTASASTIYVGDSVTFTVSASGGAGNVSVSGAANGTYWLENSSQSFTVTASAEGTLTVSASSTLGDFNTEEDVTVSGSASVQVVARPTETPKNETPQKQETQKPEEKKQEEKKLSLDEIHAELLEQLRDITAVCKKHNISYNMMCGSLLGAVRHKGFIPWDDDVDLLMTREEFQKFREIYRRSATSASS